MTKANTIPIIDILSNISSVIFAFKIIPTTKKEIKAKREKKFINSLQMYFFTSFILDLSSIYSVRYNIVIKKEFARFISNFLLEKI